MNGVIGGKVADVQVNGSSVVTDGVANVPLATNNTPGVVVGSATGGVLVDSNTGKLSISAAYNAIVKAGTDNKLPITASYQHTSTFYGMAKAAGDTTQASSSNAVGNYTENAKSAISTMLNAPVTISGTTPSITAKPGVRYVCGECATLNITVPASGDIEVIFDSGNTATVLTVTPPTGVSSIKWTNGFDPTSLDANTRYDLIITDGEWGLMASWVL